MSIIGGILDSIYYAYDAVPPGARSLGGQVAGVAGLASLSRFAPAVPKKLLINPASVYTLRYLSRHPIAALASYWIAADRNRSIRPQWAGIFTRELETAVLTPILGQSPAILRGVSGYLGAVLRPEVAQPAGTFLGLLGRARIPQVSRRLVINKVTVGLIRSVVKHPAALAAAYFTAKYIDKTYRPQFFGAFPEEIITAGLFPVFAGAPQWIPPVIRGAGTAAWYGSRGAANGLEWFLRRPPAASTPLAVTRQGSANRTSLGILSAITLEGWNYFTRQAAAAAGTSPPWYAALPGEGAAISGAVNATPWAGQQLSRLFPWIGTFSARQWWNIRQFAFRRLVNPSLLLDDRIFFKFTRFNAFYIPFTWRATGLLKAMIAAEWAYGRAIFNPTLVSAIEQVVAWSVPAAFGNTGTLRGALAEYKSWAVSAWHHIKPLGPNFIRPAWQALTRTPIAGLSLRVRFSLPALRIGADRLRTGFVEAAHLGGLGARTFTGPIGNAFGAAELSLGAVQGLFEFNEHHRLQQELIENRINRLSELEAQGVYYGPPSRTIRQNFYRRLRERGAFDGLGQYERYLDYVTSLQAATLQSSDEYHVNTFLQWSQAGLSTIASGVDSLLTSYPDYPPHDAHEDAWIMQSLRMISGGQPRASNGRFTWNPFPFATGQPGVPTGLAQALAYISRPPVIIRMVQGQTAAARPQPAHTHGGGHPGTSGREFWLFRARDRNLLLQTLRDVLEIQNRDRLEESGKTTTKISVRQPMLPDTTPGLAGAVIVLTRALEYDASLVRNREVPGGYYSIDRQKQANAG